MSLEETIDIPFNTVCDLCNKELYSGRRLVYLECLDCYQGTKLCLDCFLSGMSVGNHKPTHRVRVRGIAKGMSWTPYWTVDDDIIFLNVLLHTHRIDFASLVVGFTSTHARAHINNIAKQGPLYSTIRRLPYVGPIPDMYFIEKPERQARPKQFIRIPLESIRTFEFKNFCTSIEIPRFSGTGYLQHDVVRINSIDWNNNYMPMRLDFPAPPLLWVDVAVVGIQALYSGFGTLHPRKNTKTIIYKVLRVLSNAYRERFHRRANLISLGAGLPIAENTTKENRDDMLELKTNGNNMIVETEGKIVPVQYSFYARKCLPTWVYKCVNGPPAPLRDEKGAIIPTRVKKFTYKSNSSTSGHGRIWPGVEEYGLIVKRLRGMEKIRYIQRCQKQYRLAIENLMKTNQRISLFALRQFFGLEPPRMVFYNYTNLKDSHFPGYSTNQIAAPNFNGSAPVIMLTASAWLQEHFGVPGSFYGIAKLLQSRVMNLIYSSLGRACFTIGMSAASAAKILSTHALEYILNLAISTLKQLYPVITEYLYNQQQSIIAAAKEKDRYLPQACKNINTVTVEDMTYKTLLRILGEKEEILQYKGMGNELSFQRIVHGQIPRFFDLCAEEWQKYKDQKMMTLKQTQAAIKEKYDNKIAESEAMKLAMKNSPKVEHSSEPESEALKSVKPALVSTSASPKSTVIKNSLPSILNTNPTFLALPVRSPVILIIFSLFSLVLDNTNDLPIDLRTYSNKIVNGDISKKLLFNLCKKTKDNELQLRLVKYTKVFRSRTNYGEAFRVILKILELNFTEFLRMRKFVRDNPRGKSKQRIPRKTNIYLINTRVVKWLIDNTPGIRDEVLDKLFGPKIKFDKYFDPELCEDMELSLNIIKEPAHIHLLEVLFLLFSGLKYETFLSLRKRVLIEMASRCPLDFIPEQIRNSEFEKRKNVFLLPERKRQDINLEEATAKDMVLMQFDYLTSIYIGNRQIPAPFQTPISTRCGTRPGVIEVLFQILRMEFEANVYKPSECVNYAKMSPPCLKVLKRHLQQKSVKSLSIFNLVHSLDSLLRPPPNIVYDFSYSRHKTDEEILDEMNNALKNNNEALKRFVLSKRQECSLIDTEYNLDTKVNVLVPDEGNQLYCNLALDNGATSLSEADVARCSRSRVRQTVPSDYVSRSEIIERQPKRLSNRRCLREQIIRVTCSSVVLFYQHAILTEDNPTSKRNHFLSEYQQDLTTYDLYKPEESATLTPLTLDARRFFPNAVPRL